jgi:aminomethyltransferase
VEFVAFSPDGREMPPRSGSGPGPPEGLRRILAEESEDAQRVRYGLARRKLDIGRARCALLFSPDSPAGESIGLVAQRPATVVVAAPAAPVPAGSRALRPMS